MKKYAIIPAGGTGSRAGTEMPKQFIELLGIPMLWWAIKAFHDEDPDTKIIVALHPDYFNEFERLSLSLPTSLRDIEVTVVPGGKDRGESVANALARIPEDEDCIIGVHDAARPLIDRATITAGWECGEKYGAAVPCVPATDSLRVITDTSRKESKMVDRSMYMAVQTPQVFTGELLRRAYKLDSRPEFTDDASRVEALGINVALYEGNPGNIKVTNPQDFKIAELLLADRNGIVF